MLRSSVIVVAAVAAVIEILRVANGVVLESEGLWRRVEALALAKDLPDQPPQPLPASVGAGPGYARVLLVHGDARRRHASGEVGRPPANNVAHFWD